ncbi:MAG TPA: TadE/TadG family type IV pilus assembly protein [Phycicoccus sp.]|nr:TadE/TadG family type IV pilus assembly protein [Phycicoccus sp.]HQK30747.1 TadE/TadG family type IV pilus assembly protein [Phycicoccus sp.]
MIRRTRERGAAAVEFALILPILLVLIGGIVDFGRAFFAQVVITNAAREGARAAVVGADASARAAAAASGLPSAPAVTAGSCPSTGSAQVTVTVVTPFDWILLGPALSLIPGPELLPDQLTASATMQCGG